MTPAFYLRVSTKSQEFPSQLHALKEYCRRNNLPGIKAKPASNLFAEIASGAKVKRRELDRLLQACREGNFDTIITYRADRLGRSYPHMLQIYTELRAIKIRVIGVADGIDTENDTAATRAFRDVLARFSEMQREMIVENTRAGQAAARAAGRLPGRPRTHSDAKIAQARRLHSQGKTYRVIAKKTGISIAYLSKILAPAGKKKKAA